MVQSTMVENPLLMGLPEEKRPEPFALVIFGAHGDLTKRKLLPAIYALYVQDLLPQNFAILGSSRTKMSDEEFRAAMKDSVIKYSEDIEVDNSTWDRFAKSLYYRAGDGTQPDAYKVLKNTLEELKSKHGTMGNHLFYLSTSPTLYVPIIKNLAESGLAFKRKTTEPAWPRVVVEKPFGHDLATSIELDSILHDVLREHQIYRIDHYLGKETVQNIMCFRFANSIFEPIWNREYIDHIQITSAETLGVEDRGPYYEDAGALRDMIQNHLMQLVALVAMEPPISLDPESTRDERVKVLRAIRPFDEETIDDHAVRGQYGEGFVLGNKVKRYRDEDRVSPESNTETFAAMKLFIDNWRWAGVPIYLRSGKRLAKRETEIAIQFRKPPQKLFEEMGGSAFRSEKAESPNVLVMKIQPDDGISLKFAIKQPGPTTQIRALTMDFRYGTAFGSRSPSAYERLILDSLIGDPSLFARSDFVEASWKLYDPVLVHWKKTLPGKSSRHGSHLHHRPFPNYDSGSWGPQESEELLGITNHLWREL